MKVNFVSIIHLIHTNVKSNKKCKKKKKELSYFQSALRYLISSNNAKVPPEHKSPSHPSSMMAIDSIICSLFPACLNKRYIEYILILHWHHCIYRPFLLDKYYPLKLLIHVEQKPCHDTRHVCHAPVRHWLPVTGLYTILLPIYHLRIHAEGQTITYIWTINTSIKR